MERIALTNSSMEGNNNCYLFHSGAETVLVDTGDEEESTERELEDALEGYGLSFADIDRILLTHWHPDHTGLAGTIQAVSNASVHVHTDDAALVEGDEDAWAAYHERHERLFQEWGMPRPKRAVLREKMRDTEITRGTPDVISFEDGDTFSVDGTELRVVHAPGHAAGLCLFEFDARRGLQVLSGDALLPVYTPNVGGADVRLDDPLPRYLRALQRIAEAEYERAWPGHRSLIDNPTARATHIIQHHEERAWLILDILRRKGPLDTWSVSDELFGDLEGVHIIHGPGECHAHLRHLLDSGYVRIEETEYLLSDGVAEQFDRQETQRWPLEY